jgi:hypothetical protein
LTLDAITGNVRVRKPIDRETSPKHVLPVRVSDGIHHSDTSVVFIVSIYFAHSIRTRIEKFPFSRGYPITIGVRFSTRGTRLDMGVYKR